MACVFVAAIVNFIKQPKIDRRAMLLLPIILVLFRRSLSIYFLRLVFIYKQIAHYVEPAIYSFIYIINFMSGQTIDDLTVWDPYLRKNQPNEWYKQGRSKP